MTAFDAATGDNFGHSVAVSDDIIVVGAVTDDDAGSSSGSVYVFERVGAVRIGTAKLIASDAATNDQFGWSVAVSGDTVAVGARLDDDKGVSSGSA